MTRTCAPCILAAILTLLLVVLAPLSAAAPPRQAAQVHPAVWAALESEKEVQILILLRQQADLSGADTLLTKEEKGRYVYEAL